MFIVVVGILFIWVVFEIVMVFVFRLVRRVIDKFFDFKYDVDDDEVKDEKENKENEDLEVGDFFGSDD